eukprot:2332960-Amphidinium_carterae.3
MLCKGSEGDPPHKREEGSPVYHRETPDDSVDMTLSFRCWCFGFGVRQRSPSPGHHDGGAKWGSGLKAKTFKFRFRQSSIRRKTFNFIFRAMHSSSESSQVWTQSNDVPKTHFIPS